MKTAVIYARYSSERQTEQSIEGQLRVCHEFAERNDLKIIDTYIDRAMTGTNDNRAAFQKMLLDSDKPQPWEIVLVYALDRFGRNSIEVAVNKQELPNATAYLMKYIEKSGERIVYSKNTPAYFVSDILDDDVVCTIGQEDRKLLLFDNFICFDEGVYIGEVSPEVIKQLPKKN